MNEMTDLKLLKLAAKAAEIDWHKAHSKGLYSSAGPLWNSLTDDGDALRLAVQLGLHVAQDLDNKMVAVFFTTPDDKTTTIELWGGDPYAATRRAIVIAAAEIGRGLE